MKKQWKKRGCAAILAGAMMLSLAACGGDETETSSETNGKTQLVWWSNTRHDMNFMNEYIEKFMEENPDIEIKYVVQSENYQQNLELSFQSKQAPDIFNMPNAASDYVAKDMIAPIDEYITPEIRERFGNLINIDQWNTVDGKLYSLPNNGINYRLIYNVELFERAGIDGPPQTLAEMVEDARKITEMGKAEGIYGFAVNLKSPAGGFGRSLEQIMLRSGHHYYDYKTGRYDYEPVRPILEAFKQMYDEKITFPGVESLDIDPLRTQFADGKIGMYISGNWEVGVYNNQFPTKMEWAAAPVPVVDEVKGVSNVVTGKWLGMSSQTKHKDEVWRVMEYFYSQDVLVQYNDQGYGFSAVPSVVENSKGQQATGAEYFTLDTSVDGPWPANPNEYGVVPEGRVQHDVFAQAMYGEVSIDDAIKDLNERYNAALDKALEDGKLNEIIISDFDPLNLGF